MGVTTNSNISASLNDNRPSLIGNTQGSNLNNNPAFPLPPPYGSRATFATPPDVEFSGNNQKSLAAAAENFSQAKADAHVLIITIIGGILLLLLGMKELMARTYFETALCFVSGVAVILFSVLGNRLRDWRFIFAVLFTTVVIAVYSVVDCVITAIATVQSFRLSDAELAHLGYGGRMHVIAVCIFQCIFCVFATVYWVLIAYLNGKIVQRMRVEPARTSQQPLGSNEATTTAAGMGREATQAGSFVEFP